MARIPYPKWYAEADKQRRLKNLQAPDARKQDKDLIRMGVRAPRERRTGSKWQLDAPSITA